MMASIAPETQLHIYIYIYIERERERWGEREVDMES